MKIHSTNYLDTFISIADDCPVTSGQVPPAKGETRTVAGIQFDLIRQNPYRFTSDDILFQVFAERNELTKSEYKAAREAFFSRGQPCLRASPLTKRYGWGVHHDKNGKIAIYGCETAEYKKLIRDKSLTVIKAMRSGK
ncbi:MAG: hypothetical protein HYZ15_12540 [Sphingobacteriales bacterium]|nr:hypothetical protein [Sphingobacteriales bacterium]